MFYIHVWLLHPSGVKLNLIIGLVDLPAAAIRLALAYSPNFSWLVTSYLDTTRSTCRAIWARHVERVEQVELVVFSSAVRQARHSRNAWARHVRTCRVVLRPDATRANWNLGLITELRTNSVHLFCMNFADVVWCLKHWWVKFNFSHVLFDVKAETNDEKSLAK